MTLNEQTFCCVLVCTKPGRISLFLPWSHAFPSVTQQHVRAIRPAPSFSLLSTPKLLANYSQLNLKVLFTQINIHAVIFQGTQVPLWHQLPPTHWSLLTEEVRQEQQCLQQSGRLSVSCSQGRTGCPHPHVTSPSVVSFTQSGLASSDHRPDFRQRNLKPVAEKRNLSLCYQSSPCLTRAHQDRFPRHSGIATSPESVCLAKLREEEAYFCSFGIKFKALSFFP